MININMIYEFIYNLWKEVLITISSGLDFYIIKEFVLILGIFSLIAYISYYIYKKNDESFFLYQKKNVLKIIIIILIVIIINVFIYKNIDKISPNNNKYIGLNGKITENNNLSLDNSIRDIQKLLSDNGIQYNSNLLYEKDIDVQNSSQTKKLFYSLNIENPIPIELVDGQNGEIEFTVYEINNGNLNKNKGLLNIKNIQEEKKGNKATIRYTIKLKNRNETSVYRSDGIINNTPLYNKKILLFSEKDINNFINKSQILSDRKNPFLLRIENKNLIHPFFIYNIISNPPAFLPTLREDISFNYKFLMMNFTDKANGKIVSEDNSHLTITFMDISAFGNFTKYLFDNIGVQGTDGYFYDNVGLSVNYSNIDEAIKGNSISKMNIISLIVSLVMKMLLFILTFLSFMIYPFIVIFNWQLCDNLLD